MVQGSTVFQQADMIEIHLGQGASASIGYIIDSKFIDEELRKMLELQPGERAIVESTDPKRFRRLVPYLKEISDGIPIGCKFGFSDHLEEDIDIALEAGVDILALEGSQAATKGAPPILSDDFGLPTIIGLTRAVKHLKLRGMKDKVDLIVSGGLFTPGHFLKAIALGADAVYIGSIALFAMTHKQVFKSLPWEPPTQVVWYSGKHKNRFNWSEGAKALSRFLIACNEEIKEGIMALGKTSIKEVDRNDLVAIDPKAAKICDLSLAYEDIPIRNRTPLRS